MPAITKSRKRFITRLDVVGPLIKPLLEGAKDLAGIVEGSGAPDMGDGCRRGDWLGNQEDLMAIDAVSLDTCLAAMETQIKLIRRHVR